MINRLIIMVLGCSLALTAPVTAEDVMRLDAEKLAKITKPLLESTAKLTDVPIKFTPDGERAMGLEARKAALVVIPDQKLTPEALAKLDKEVLPLGMLYLHKVTIVTGGEPVPLENHRTMEITVEGKTASVTVMPVAAARVAGKLVLLAYTSKKEPTLVTELVDAEESKSTPLDLEARTAGEGRAFLLVNVLSKYRAVITVAAQE